MRGDQRGREIGYPTANLEPLPWSAVPADGVYAGRLVRRGEALPAAISIGTNPTFQGRERRVEAFVLDWSGDLYGEHVGLTFTARLRETLALRRGRAAAGADGEGRGAGTRAAGAELLVVLGQG